MSEKTIPTSEIGKEKGAEEINPLVDNLYWFLKNPETGESYFEKLSDRESGEVMKILDEK